MYAHFQKGKTVKKETAAVTDLFSAYVDADNNIIWKRRTRLFSMPDEEIERHKAILNDVLCLALGKKAHEIDLQKQCESVLTVVKDREEEDFEDVLETRLIRTITQILITSA